MKTQALLDRLTTSIDVDPEFLEVLIPYLDGLLAIGVDLSSLRLQSIVEGYLQCEFRKV